MGPSSIRMDGHVVIPRSALPLTKTPAAAIYHILRALRVSEKVADGIPVPGLKSAINIAWSIVEMAEEAKSTRERSRDLAERAGRFTLAVYEHLRGCDTAVKSIETTAHVANFLCALEDIEAYMRRQGRKKLFALMLAHGRKAEEIGRLTTQLEDAVRLFNIQASVYAKAQLSLITDAQSRLLNHADDADRVGAIILSHTRIVEAGVTELVQRDATADGTTRRVLPGASKDGTRTYNIPILAGADEPKILYIYENFSLRSEGVFEIPVGYWSTSPDDLPTTEEIRRRGTHSEGRNIAFGGSTECGLTTWVQQLRDSKL
ncbi:hypothetical protein C8T65DRAFT_763795 [Cerioporus squamosus]|nr:hypothetical protein C8T65DRAFT_763795 [Cerioporus squamosus]